MSEMRKVEFSKSLSYELVKSWTPIYNQNGLIDRQAMANDLDWESLVSAATAEVVREIDGIERVREIMRGSNIRIDGKAG